MWIFGFQWGFEWQIEAEELYKVFAKYGKLKNDQEGICLKKNREWYAFVEFEEDEAGGEAIKK